MSKEISNMTIERNRCRVVLPGGVIEIEGFVGIGEMVESSVQKVSHGRHIIPPTGIGPQSLTLCCTFNNESAKCIVLLEDLVDWCLPLLWDVAHLNVVEEEEAEEAMVIVNLVLDPIFFHVMLHFEVCKDLQMFPKIVKCTEHDLFDKLTVVDSAIMLQVWPVSDND